MLKTDDFRTNHLTANQKNIADAILAVARRYNPEADGGGCKAFYTPDEWKARKEKYGTDSVLIVVHDGGDLAHYFNYDYQAYKSIEAMDKALDSLGFYAEPCTTWYTAIYQR